MSPRQAVSRSGNTRLTSLWQFYPERAARDVKGVLDRPGMTVVVAASILHISVRTLYRWIGTRDELKAYRGKLPRGQDM
jgi:hypothetical protein